MSWVFSDGLIFCLSSSNFVCVVFIRLLDLGFFFSYSLLERKKNYVFVFSVNDL